MSDLYAPSEGAARRHLIGMDDLSREDVERILDTAASFEAVLAREVKKVPTLRGRTIITMFYENSTRTRVSFEVAGKWMSADVINVSASSCDRSAPDRRCRMVTGPPGCGRCE